MKQIRSAETGSLMLPLIIVIVLLLGALIFAGWAFTGMQDYKNNSDKKSAAAVEIAIKNEDAKNAAKFAEAEKSPFRSYQGPSTYGTITFDYPKTWSQYASSNGGLAIDNYFNPISVPDINSKTAFALRMQVIDGNYTATLKSYDSSVSTGKTKVAAYRAPKVGSVLGSMLTGAIDTSGLKQGTLVMFPLRDKTLEIWTEGNDYTSDFTNTVLASLTFIP